MTEVVPEEIVLEDLDFAPPCNGKDCDNEAKFKMTMRCCAAMWLLCERCRNLEIEWAAAHQREGHCRCTRCHAEWGDRPELPFVIDVL